MSTLLVAARAAQPPAASAEALFCRDNSQFSSGRESVYLDGQSDIDDLVSGRLRKNRGQVRNPDAYGVIDESDRGNHVPSGDPLLEGRASSSSRLWCRPSSDPLTICSPRLRLPTLFTFTETFGFLSRFSDSIARIILLEC